MSEQCIVIKLSDTRVAYDTGELFRATAAIREGELCALIGRNGTGKSTLLRILAGITPPSRGEVFVGGVDLADSSPRELAQLVSFVSTE
ncbi:MAG: ATP-binding cassette domain-containing protein [Rikenellaceae bacterium]|nr:ATP-binding cassette domain-containing protein [Rikenellaceae bacterium]